MDVRVNPNGGVEVPANVEDIVREGVSVVVSVSEGVIVGVQCFPLPRDGSSKTIQSNEESVSAAKGHLAREAPSDPNGIGGWKRS